MGSKGSFLGELLGGVIVLNGLDAILTMLWVYSGQATEANPLMANLLNSHPVLFVLVKILLVGLGSLVLYKRREHQFAAVGIVGLFIVYYGILIYHLQSGSFALLGS